MQRERWIGKSHEDLQSYLRSFDIPIDGWGMNGTKTVAHLLDELQNGESDLEIVDKKLIRHVTGVGINIYYQTGKQTLKLTEDRQVFSNKSHRQRKISTSLGEKMLPGELPQDAAKRALKEELDIKDYEFGDPTIEDREPKISATYPGLLTKHLVYIFTISLKKKDYKPEGYTEVQSDKTTYFIWQAQVA